MSLEIEVGAVGDALEFGEVAAPEVEAVLDVDGALRVVRQLLFRVFEEAHVLGVEAQLEIPVPPLLQPVLVPRLVGARLDEELHLHLLELAGAEDEVAGSDLVAEALAGLGHAERRLLAGRGRDVLVVDEDPLCGLGTQVVQALFVLDRAQVGLEQAVEHPRLGELALDAAVRAVDLGKGRRRASVLGLVPLFQVIGPEAVVAVGALGQWVDELGQVARRLPDIGRQDDGRVEPDDVVAAGDHRLPPLAADVLFELDAEGPVVPS